MSSGSLSIDDGDVNENGKKKKQKNNRFDWQNNNTARARDGISVIKFEERDFAF